MKVGYRIGPAFGVAALALATGCWKGPGTGAEPPQVSVAVYPQAAAVTVGRTATFSARVDGEAVQSATFRVLEAGGGSIEANGTYHAPAVPGVYTVQAAFQVGAGRTAVAQVRVVAPPTGTIDAPARIVQGSGDLVARVPKVEGSRYAWTLQGGTITGGADTEVITFSAGAGPRMVLGCTVTNAAGDAVRSSLEVQLVPPVSVSVSPAAATVTAGRSMKFGFTIQGGTSLEVRWSLGEPGAGSLGQDGRYVAPEVPGLYTVRVAAQDDPTRSAVAQVKVVPRPPESLVTGDTFKPGAEGLRAEVPDVPGMTYAWEIEGGTLTGGAGSPKVTFTAGAGPVLTLRCRITNEAGDSFVATRVMKVEVAEP